MCWGRTVLVPEALGHQVFVLPGILCQKGCLIGDMLEKCASETLLNTFASVPNFQMAPIDLQPGSSLLPPHYNFSLLGFVARCAVLSRELLRRRPEVLGAFVGEAAWAWGSRLAALVLNFSWSWSRALCSICSAPEDFAEVACESSNGEWCSACIDRDRLVFSLSPPAAPPSLPWACVCVADRFGVDGENRMSLLPDADACDLPRRLSWGCATSPT